MKRKIIGFIFIAVLAVVAAAPVCAFEDYGIIYDDTGVFDKDAMTTLSGEMLTALSERYHIETRVDIITDLQGRTLDDYAAGLYEQYGYGYRDGDDGVLLLVAVHPDDSGLTFDGYTVYYGGDADTIFTPSYRETLDTALDIRFNAEAWQGDASADNAVCVEGITAYAGVLDNILGSVITENDGAVATTAGAFVSDGMGYLNAAEMEDLNAKAREISDRYQCGIYAKIVADFKAYNSDSVRDAAETIFADEDMGYGDDKNGVFLLLSMAERDYALIAHGTKGNRAFTDYGKDVLAEEFLDDFGNDDWAGGFSDYIAGCERYLDLDAEGTPFDVGSTPKGKAMNLLYKLLFIIVLPLAVALAVCLFLRRQMKTVFIAGSAKEYLDADSVEITTREDRFSHVTEVITKISDDDHRGGTTVNSGGFSGKSGKF